VRDLDDASSDGSLAQQQRADQLAVMVSEEAGIQRRDSNLAAGTEPQ